MFTNIIPTQNILASKYWKEVRRNTGNKIVEVNDSLWIQCTKIPILNMYGGYIPRADLNKLNEEELRNVAKRENIFFIKIDPSNSKPPETENNTETNSGYTKNFSDSRESLPVQYQHTTVINLEQSYDDFLEKMKSKTRYNLKLSEKWDLKVSISNENTALDTFLDLYKKTTLRQGYTGRSENYLKKVFETLKSFNQDLVQIATVTFEGRAVSSWMLLTYEDSILYVYGGSSDENRNLMATYKLVSEIFTWGKGKGYKYFDMFGIDVKNPEDGFSRFKLGFGGELVSFSNTFDIIYNSMLYSFYKIWEKFAR